MVIGSVYVIREALMVAWFGAMRETNSPVEILEPDFYSLLFWIGLCSCSLWREWFLGRGFSYYLRGGASCPVSSIILLFDSERTSLGNMHLGLFLERDFRVLLESTVLRPINCQSIKIRLSFSNQDISGLYIFSGVLVEVESAGIMPGVFLFNCIRYKLENSCLEVCHKLFTAALA